MLSCSHHKYLCLHCVFVLVHSRKICGLKYKFPIPLLHAKETTVAQWLRCCATNRKVAGSIPDGVIEFFIDIILLIALWPWGRLSL